MFYILGLKISSSGETLSPFQVGQQILVSTEKGFDKDSKEQIELGFVVQGPNSNATLLEEKPSLEEALEYISKEFEVFEMPLTEDFKEKFGENIKARFGVRRLSKGELAQFDFSPSEFGGKPYEPIFLADGCEVLLIRDNKGILISEYMKAAIGGQCGNVDSPLEKDLEKGRASLKQVGFEFEEHTSKEWGVYLLIGKEPKLV